jgi:hypothetical protein
MYQNLVFGRHTKALCTVEVSRPRTPTLPTNILGGEKENYEGKTKRGNRMTMIQ